MFAAKASQLLQHRQSVSAALSQTVAVEVYLPADVACLRHRSWHRGRRREHTGLGSGCRVECNYSAVSAFVHAGLRLTRRPDTPCEYYTSSADAFAPEGRS